MNRAQPPERDPRTRWTGDMSMKVNVLRRSANELKIEIVGERHSFCNALQMSLLEDKRVEFAGYDLAHPLVAQPVVRVLTKGSRKPEDALIAAAKRLGKQMDDFIKAFEDACETK